MPKGFAELNTRQWKPWVTLVLHEDDLKEGKWPEVIILAERCFHLQGSDPGAEVPRATYREVSCHFA